MRKNTGCSTGNGGCPEPSTNIVKSKSMPAQVEVLPGGRERTVVLGNVFIQTLTEADIKLPTHAREIKHIKKNVSLTECKATPDVINPRIVNLFIEGVVHKNIQYVESGYGVVKDFSVDIPFRAYERVFLFNEIETAFSIKDNVIQTRQLAPNKMEANRCEFGSITFEFNNEPIECKLLISAVNQWDIVHNFDNWSRFNKITEKMDVILGIQLSQKQFIPGIGAAEAESLQDKFSNITKL